MGDSYVLIIESFDVVSLFDNTIIPSCVSLNSFGISKLSMLTAIIIQVINSALFREVVEF